MKVDVVIMAGGKSTQPLRECSERDYEALIEINGMPMVEYVVRAARQSTSVGRIAVIGPVEQLQPFLKDQADLLVEGKDRMIDNLREGITALATDRKVLILCADIPLISPGAIDEFVKMCMDRDADFYYPIISKESNLERFPGTRRTYARLKDGTYTGGNIFILNPAIVDGAVDFMNKMIVWRKKPLKLSRAFGLKFIVKFVAGRLSILELESRVRELTGFSAAALAMEYPEVGFDVDKPSDLELIKMYLKYAN